MKNKIKRWILKYLQDDDNKFNPKKNSDLKGVCFESKDPLGNGKYQNYICDVTSWANGEGFQISINTYNENSKKQTDKNFSFNHQELDLILACLTDLNYFEID